MIVLYVDRDGKIGLSVVGLLNAFLGRDQMEFDLIADREELKQD